MDFKVGDIVVLDNLEEDVPHNPGVVVDHMEPMLGKEWEISSVSQDIYPYIKLKGDPYDYHYAPEWFVPKNATKKKKKKKVAYSSKNYMRYVPAMRKTLKEKASANATASYAVMSDAGISFNANDVCHARIKAGYSVKEIIAVLDIHNKWKEHIPTPMHKAYKEAVKYVIAESPWKNAFLSNNHVNFLQHGVLLNVEEKNSYVAQAVMALRMPKERQSRLKVFDLVKKAGFSGDVAYLMFMAFEPIRSKQFSLSIPGGHTPLSGGFPLSTLLSFIKGDMSFFKGEKRFKSPGNWSIFSKFDRHYRNEELPAVYKETLHNFMKKRLQSGDYTKFVKKEGGGWGGDYYYYTKEAILKIAGEIETLLKELNHEGCNR